MRDIFNEIFENQPVDPAAAARRSLRPTALRKRFYRSASVGTDNGVLLDGKPVRTPARRLLAAPTAELAQALAEEWNAQAETIDPASMPLTRLANAVIDGVADAPGAVADEVAQYLGSDLLFYRADAPAGLIEAQARHWDPLLAFARHELGARFVLAQGLIYVEQPREAVAAARTAIPSEPNSSKSIWLLGAVSAITTLTGSALIALAMLRGRIDADAAWAAAHVDEDWNMAAWGRDDAALTRRAARFIELRAAATVLRLVG